MTVHDLPEHDPPRWESRAACNGADANLFFPERGESKARVAEAKAICARCPVKDECLAEGLYLEHGIWGGLTGKERKRARRLSPRHGSRQRSEAGCRCPACVGSRHGRRWTYLSGCRCESCREAQRRYQRTHRVRVAS